MKGRKKKNVIRVNFGIILLVMALLVLIIFKLAYVVLNKTVDGIDLKEFADGRNTVEKTLYASRGSIFDRNGEVLAQSVNSYTVIAYLSSTRTEDEKNPQHVVDKQLTADSLAPIINMSSERILSLLNKKAYQVELGPGGRNISELTKKKIEQLNLPGIDFTVNTKRYYKMGTFASYIIGYAKENDNGKITGEMGVEKSYNSKLKGVDGSKKYQVDAYGYQMPNTPVYEISAKPGNDIYLTIDSNIQLFAENAIAKLDKDYDFSWMTFSVMDAKTGAIVASATSPNFNLNKLETLTSYLNPLVSYQYEPGSTMKIFSFMAAMENGIYDGNATYQSGEIKVADVVIKDFNDVGWGTINYDTGFMYSSNVAASKLALKLGVNKLKDFYSNLGFGKKTGIELPDELAGTLKFTYQSELANAAFGQGITTTPVQNLQALSTITNDGEMLKPYIVEKIVDNEGKTVFEANKTSLGKKISTDTVNKMKVLLHRAVYESITTNKYYQPKTVSLIGKTGTAQIAGKGGYLKGEYDYIKSFAGIFPEEDPKYIIYVSVKQYVGPMTPLAGVVNDAVDDIANYANLSQTVTKSDDTKIITIDNYLNKKVEQVTVELEQKGLVPVVIGDGNFVIKNYPEKGKKAVLGNKVFLLTNSSSYKVPDFSGWSKNEALTFCNLVNIKCNMSNKGKVVSQSIPAGTVIEPNMELNIDFN